MKKARAQASSSGTLTRRALMMTGASALVSCKSRKSSSVGRTAFQRAFAHLSEAEPDALPKILASELRRGLSLATLGEALSVFAVQRIDTRAATETGIVSHAFLSVLPAIRLSRRLPEPRAALPLLQASVFVAQEARHSPYTGGPFELPELIVEQTIADPLSELRAAVRASSARSVERVERAEYALACLLAQGSSKGSFNEALIDLSTRQIGHNGHGAIMLSMCQELCLLYPRRRSLLRAPVRYLASFSVPDGTLRRAERQSGRSARQLTDQAEDILLSTVDDDTNMGSLHLLTSQTAVRQMVDARQGTPIAKLATKRAAAWMDMTLEGVSELGILRIDALRAAAEVKTAPYPLPSRATTKLISDAMKAGDHRRVVHEIERYVQTGQKSDALIRYLIELACLAGRPSLQHSLKAMDAALYNGRGRSLAVVARILTHAANGGDPLYARMLEALGLEPHPLLEL